MPYMTGLERLGFRKGVLMAIESALRVLLGKKGTKLMPGLDDVYDTEKLLFLHEVIAKAIAYEHARRAVAGAVAPFEPLKKSSRRKQK